MRVPIGGHHHRLLTISLLALATSCVALAADQTAPAQMVGSQTCIDCHQDQADHLKATPHGRPGFAALSPNGCETCHGPGSIHAGDPNNEAYYPKVDAATTCQKCHSGGAQFFWKGSTHETRGLTCTQCHSVHDAKSAEGQLKQASAMEQCFTCHKDVRAESWKTSHHPLREGRIGCNDCHNPHGTESPKLINAVSVNELCYNCHTEKRGPFLWDHAPVRENCMTCHNAHGSNHLKLQRTSVPYLCQQCHMNTRHPGTLYDRTTLADQARASNRIFNRACVDCHAEIHGSNHPSSPYLGH